MRCSKMSILSAVTLAAFSWASPSLPAVTDTFDVTITLQSSCDLSTAPTDMDFGSVGLLSQDYTASSSIYVTCTSGTNYELELDDGQNADATTRRMFDGDSSYVSYRLYRDNGRTELWGDGTTFGNASARTGTGSEETVAVYGSVLQLDNPSTPPAGAYSDTVTVTVTF